MRFDANHALIECELPGIPMISRGKVRDIFDLGDALLFVATDRLSAFDVVLPTGIGSCMLKRIPISDLPVFLSGGRV